MLVSVFYSIDCHRYFPFLINEHKFNWNEFYSLHEKMTDTDLAAILSD